MKLIQNKSIKLFNGNGGIRFIVQRIGPHIVTEIINRNKVIYLVKLTMGEVQRSVYYLEWKICKYSGTRKGQPNMAATLASITHTRRDVFIITRKGKIGNQPS